MSDVTIIKERGRGGFGTMAKVFANNEDTFEILKEMFGTQREKCFTIHFEAAEEMAETLKEKGLDVEIK